MADSDDILALYGAIRKLAESMEQREAALDEKTEAFNAAITTLQQLPYKLGQQTSQYVSMGVRQSLEQDFKLPVDELVKRPLQGFGSLVGDARDTLLRVKEATRYYSFRYRALLVSIGILIGAVGMCFYFNHQIDSLNERIERLQLLLPVMPIQDPAAVKPLNSGKRHGQH